MGIKNLFTIRNLLVLLLIGAAFVELGCLSFYRKGLGVFGTPILLLTSGLFIGITFLALFYKRTLINVPEKKINESYLLDLGLFCGGIYYSGQQILTFIKRHPIDDFYTVQGSDVIPAIGIMVDRFLNGVFPYTMIEDTDWGFTYPLLLNYFPLTWMPFIGAEFLGVDYRIYAFGILVISILVVYKQFIFRNTPFVLRAIALVIPFSFLYLFSSYNFELQFVIETMIVGFYLLLTVSFFSKKSWLLPLMLTICLLSRYSIILYVPLILGVYGIEKGWQTPLKISVKIGFGILLIYVLPFLSKDFSLLEKGFKNYTKTTVEAWELSDKQELESRYSLFNSGVGMSIFAYRGIDATIQNKLKIYRGIHLVLSILVVLILGLFYWKFKNCYDYRIFLLGGLKIYFVVFYNFIQYPFIYLFLVPIFISIPIIYLSLRKTVVYPKLLTVAAPKKS